MTDHALDAPSPENRIVYIRAVDPQEIPEPARSRADTDKFFAICDSEGNRLAVTTNRDMAFTLARGNDLKPVSAH